jgi:hypothetical protein
MELLVWMAGMAKGVAFVKKKRAGSAEKPRSQQSFLLLLSGPARVPGASFRACQFPSTAHKCCQQ